MYASDIRDAIKSADYTGLEIEINSPGGAVTEGIAIYNLIKNAKGQKKVKIIGLAASMASYIALAGDSIEVEADSVFMIHNVSGAATGDAKKIRKTADVIEGLNNILVKRYAEKTGVDEKKIRGLMDEETYYFGAEIVEAGFADVVLGGEIGDKTKAIADSVAHVELAQDMAKKLTTDDDIDTIAAILTKNEEKTDCVAIVEAAGPKKEEVEMTEQEIEALKSKAFADGVQAEKMRVADLRQFEGHGPESKKAVDDAIGSGKTYHEAMPSIVAAVAADKMVVREQENAPQFEAMQAKSEQASEEELKLCSALGLSIEKLKGAK